MTTEPDLQSGFRIGPFAVVPERNLVTWEGNEIHLEPKQMKALVALAQHQPGVVSKQMLIDAVWDGRSTSDESITGCIKGLRAGLNNDNPRKPKYVETIHGSGYRLIVPIAPIDKSPGIATSKPPRGRLPLVIAVIVAAAALVYFFTDLPQRTSSTRIDSVVITQCANLSSETTQPTVDGITDHVISTLYEVPGLQIKKGSLPASNDIARDIADRYGVGWVVFCSVQRMNGQVRINARIDDRDSVVQWAGTFAGTDTEVFALHEQFVTAIRDEIHGKEEESVSAPSQPANPAAYDNFLLGQFYLAKRNRASLDQAVSYFETAIRLDQNYGPAYLDLANTYLLLADYGAKEELFDLAVATAEEGVTRDPEIRDAAQTVHGYVLTKRRDWVAATEAFDIATRDIAEYPVSHHYHSVLLAAVGRVDASLDAATRAWEMEPDSQVLNSRLAIAYFWKNDIENARRYYAIANTLGAGAPISQLSYALFLVRDGRIDEARENVRRAMEQLKVDTVWVDAVFDELKKPMPSAALNSLLAEYSGQQTIPPNVLMTFWAIAGQPDQALKIAWESVDEPGLIDIELFYLEEFRGLRQHEDFGRLTGELGLQAYWDSAGCQWNGDQLNCPGD